MPGRPGRPGLPAMPVQRVLPGPLAAPERPARRAPRGRMALRALPVPLVPPAMRERLVPLVRQEAMVLRALLARLGMLAPRGQRGRLALREPPGLTLPSQGRLARLVRRGRLALPEQPAPPALPGPMVRSSGTGTLACCSQP